MFLSAIMLKNVQGVNSYQGTTQLTLRQGNPAPIYFQLVDLEQTDKYGNPLRYMPAAGATCTATISSINLANVISRPVIQPYTQDTSIWQMQLFSTDMITTGNFQFTLTEGSTVRTGYVQNGIIVQTTNPSMC